MAARGGHGHGHRHGRGWRERDLRVPHGPQAAAGLHNRRLAQQASQLCASSSSTGSGGGSVAAAPASVQADVLLDEWYRPAAVPLTVAPLADLEAALAVNRAMAVSPKAEQLGGHCGWKMGWKGVFAERPTLCGPLFGMGLMNSGTSVSLSSHRLFSAEAEFCVVLKAPLEPKATAYSEAEVWAAVGTVQLCIELCGARQFQSDDRLHSVADALLGCGVVRGPVIGMRDEVDPASLLTHRVAFSLNGVEISSGDAANNPGNSPLASLTSLANELCVERGMQVAAGALVICGHCCMAGFAGRPAPGLVWPNPRQEWGGADWVEGDVLRADFGALGAVEVTLLS
jgi:2-keto-4-pentenoate hydratase